MSETIYHDSYVTVWFHPQWRLVHHQVHQPLRGKPLRNALTAGLDCVRDRTATKWLSDDRLHYVIPSEDQEWANGTWFPAARDAGWRYWAIVTPKRAVAGLFIRRMADSFSSRGVETELFSTPEHAMAWVQSVGAPAESGGKDIE